MAGQWDVPATLDLHLVSAVGTAHGAEPSTCGVGLAAPGSARADLMCGHPDSMHSGRPTLVLEAGDAHPRPIPGPPRFQGP